MLSWTDTLPGAERIEALYARKGFSKPLIDTSHMLNSVDYEVN